MPVIETSAGRVELADGDWIVTAGSGARTVVKAEAFRAAYEFCPLDEIRPFAERVRKGIPLRSG